MDRSQPFAAAFPLFLRIIGGPSQITNLARGPVWHNGAIIVALTTLLIGGALAGLLARLVRRRLEQS